MKRMMIFGLLLLGAAGLNGCQKEEEAKPAENAFTAYLDGENTVSKGTRSSGPWELGVVISASVAGQVTQVGSRMPEPGTYRLIVWDFDTKQVLRQKTVEQTAPAKLTLEGVEPLALVPNKKYVISINSQSEGAAKKYSFAYKTGGGEFMPVTTGNILLHNACYKYTSTASFPDGTKNVVNELYGFPEITFIPD